MTLYLLVLPKGALTRQFFCFLFFLENKTEIKKCGTVKGLNHLILQAHARC